MNDFRCEVRQVCVIEIELADFELYEENSTELYRGRTEAYINVYEIDESGHGERLYSKELDFMFPTEVPRPAFKFPGLWFQVGDVQIHATQELGWKSIEMRSVQLPGIQKAILHDLPDAAFDFTCKEIGRAGLEVYCFGSAIMNWARKVGDPFQITQEEVRRTIPRMRRLEAKYVRIMSFKPGDAEDQIPTTVFDRVREVTQRFRDAGITAVHENCMNYGGMSWQHARQLLDKVPDLKWVFDTANPVFNPDRAKPKPWPQQDPWEFWTQVRDQVAHIHIKDATWNASR